MDINHHLKLRTSTWQPTMANVDDNIFDNHHHHQQQQRQFPFDHNPIWPSFPLQTPYHHLPSFSSESQQQQRQQQVPFDHVGNNHVQTLIEDHHDQEPEDDENVEEEELGAMKEMMFKIAAMQPVDIDPATIRKPKRRNVRISNDPQSVAARLRREKISEKIRILQRLVPGGTKMDTASMLDEAIRYVKFLKRQIRQLQSSNHHLPPSQVLVVPCPSTENWANMITPTKALILGSSDTSTTSIATTTTFVGNSASTPMYEVIGN